MGRGRGDEGRAEPSWGEGGGYDYQYTNLSSSSSTYFDWVMIVSLNCGATGMAAWAVEAMMLRYQITIVSSTVGVASSEYLQREIHHMAVQTLACSPPIPSRAVLFQVLFQDHRLGRRLHVRSLVLCFMVMVLAYIEAGLCRTYNQ